MNETRDLSQTSARRLFESAQGAAERAADVAERAGGYVQASMGRVSDRAQDLAQNASARVEQLTGRSVESLAGDVSRLVRDNPLRAIAVTIAIGYVLGKVLGRR
jgi:ElaB/YqjD/DUF883 family membrane-anchored ribosome-binding protein